MRVLGRADVGPLLGVVGDALVAGQALELRPAGGGGLGLDHLDRLAGLDVPEELQQALRRGRRVAGRVSRDPSGFLAATSHDADTPVGSLSHLLVGLALELLGDLVPEAIWWETLTHLVGIEQAVKEVSPLLSEGYRLRLDGRPAP